MEATMQQLNMFGPPETVDAAKMRGRCDWAPVPWERENLWPEKMAAALGQELCERMYGDVPRHTRLQVEQICRRLNCDSNTVYRLIEAGEFDAANVGAGDMKALYRIYRYSVIWFLFRREFVTPSIHSRPAMLENLTAEDARKISALVAQVKKGGCR